MALPFEDPFRVSSATVAARHTPVSPQSSHANCPACQPDVRGGSAAPTGPSGGDDSEYGMALPMVAGAGLCPRIVPRARLAVIHGVGRAWQRVANARCG